jgi:hypothetical protein
MRLSKLIVDNLNYPYVMMFLLSMNVVGDSDKTYSETNTELVNQPVPQPHEVVMNRNRRTPILIGALAGIIVFAVLSLVAAGAYYLGSTRSQPSASISPSAVPSPEHADSATPIGMRITWDVPAGSVPQTEESLLKHALNQLSTQMTAVPSSYVSITSAKVEGDWGILYGERKAIDTQATQTAQATDLSVFLAHKTQADWRIIMTKDADFCQVLQQLPDTVLSQDGKDYFLGCRSQ